MSEDASVPFDLASGKTSFSSILNVCPVTSRVVVNVAVQKSIEIRRISGGAGLYWCFGMIFHAVEPPNLAFLQLNISGDTVEEGIDEYTKLSTSLWTMSWKGVWDDWGIVRRGFLLIDLGMKMIVFHRSAPERTLCDCGVIMDAT